MGLLWWAKLNRPLGGKCMGFKRKKRWDQGKVDLIFFKGKWEKIGSFPGGAKEGGSKSLGHKRGCMKEKKWQARWWKNQAGR